MNLLNSRFHLLVLSTFLMFLAPVLAQDLPVVSVQDAHQIVSRGEALLVDVRTPNEWKVSGLPKGAVPISWHDPKFMRKLRRTAGIKSRPIILICAIAGRSHDVQVKLMKAGYTNVRNVQQGILGNEHGFGWQDEGLPTERYQGEAQGISATDR